MQQSQDWFYNPSSWWVKALRFANLVEDATVKLSLTGFTMWATTLQNLHALAFTHDRVQMGFSMLAHAAGLLAHTVKRAQTLKAKL